MDLNGALIAALSVDLAERRRGEGQLSDAAASPHFCTALLEASATSSGLPDAARLLAATTLKNEAVRHWRRGASREGDQVSLRSALIGRLTQAEPLQPVGMQLALTVARVMRSEANRGEATVLEAFAATLRASYLPGHALLALVHTGKELGSMRLPRQKALAARVGEYMLAPLASMWEASVRAICAAAVAASAVAASPAGSAAACAGGALSLEALRTVVLQTKALRRMMSLAQLAPKPVSATTHLGSTHAGDSSSGEAAMAAGPSAPSTAAGCAPLALEMARAIQGTPVAVLAHEVRAEWSRLGGAIGKLLLEVYGFACGAEWSALQLGGPDAQSAPQAQAQAQAQAQEAQAQLLQSAATLLLAEGESRRALRAAHALDELAAREAYCSKLAARCITLLERGCEQTEWLEAHAASLGPLVHSLVVLMGRPIDQLRRWEADPESFACEALLAMDGHGFDVDEDDDEEAAAAAGALACGSEDDGLSGMWSEDEGGAEEARGNDDDGGDGDGDGDGNEDDEPDGRAFVADAGGSSGAVEDRLRAAAEDVLYTLLYARPTEVTAALFQLLPSSPSTPDEPLGQQIHREACYAALGVGACELQATLSFAQMLGAASSEAEALLGATAQGTAAAVPQRPPLVAALQARLCWLISCWWAFGGQGDALEDERMCSASYALLGRMANSGADLAVRLQASQVLHTLLHGCSAEDVRVFAPHASDVLQGLASTLAICTEDDACLWVLRALRTLLRQVPPTVLSPQARDGVAAVLGSAWQRAEAESRPLLLTALKRVANAMNAFGTA